MYSLDVNNRLDIQAGSVTCNMNYIPPFYSYILICKVIDFDIL